MVFAGDFSDHSSGQAESYARETLIVRSYNEDLPGSDGGDFSLPPSASTSPSAFPTVDVVRLSNASVDQSAHGMTKDKRIYQIVGGTIGGVVFIVISIVLLFLYRRSKRIKRHSGPYAMGPLQAVLPKSKEAFTSPHYSHYGLSFTPSAPPSTDSLPLPEISRISRLRHDSTATSHAS